MTSAPASSPHVERYLARVDAHLPTLADDKARQRFLLAERDKWEERYAAFAARVDAGLDTHPAVTAWDYVDTICDLEIRIGRLSQDKVHSATAATAVANAGSVS